ncbi:unnamed protein product [Mytilus edulis]|uniref:Uncharacterized protein n=1 Tax=Mytilus edulis TaxID=6550 RepID=A0A8S3VHQ6_MYTED|nr:unnamed protein product [Mytilus edulis]
MNLLQKLCRGGMRIDDPKESLFNIYSIKPAEFRPDTYCTCNKLATKYPYGEPDINCQLKASLKLCTEMTIPKSIYQVSCRMYHLKTRRKRSALTGNEIESIVQEDDDAPEMYLMDVTEGEESNVSFDLNRKKGQRKTTKHNYANKGFQDKHCTLQFRRIAKTLNQLTPIEIQLYFPNFSI